MLPHLEKERRSAAQRAGRELQDIATKAVSIRTQIAELESG